MVEHNGAEETRKKKGCCSTIFVVSYIGVLPLLQSTVDTVRKTSAKRRTRRRCGHAPVVWRPPRMNDALYLTHTLHYIKGCLY